MDMTELLKRPEIIKGSTRLIKTGCGDLYVTINRDHTTGDICEIFASMGKAGGCAASQAEAIARLAGLALRSGTSPLSVVRQLKGIECNHPNENAKSCADAVATAIEKYLKNSELLFPVNASSMEKTVDAEKAGTESSRKTELVRFFV